MLSRPLLNAAADESYADSAADDADDAEAAASAVTANALPPPVAPDIGGPGGDFIIMAWVIALLAAPIALMLVVLPVSSILPREGFIGNMGMEG
jgi:hypothetical protein